MKRFAKAMGAVLLVVSFMALDLLATMYWEWKFLAVEGAVILGGLLSFVFWIVWTAEGLR